MTEETDKTPETPADNPPALPKPVLWNEHAVFEWLSDDGTVQSTDTNPRSRAELLRFLFNKVTQDEKLLARQVRITETGFEMEPGGKKGQEVQRIVAEGPVAQVMDVLKGMSIPPNAVLFDFRRMCEFMSERSALKGIMITAVFGDAEIGGFGYLTSMAEVTDADIITLAEAASSQAQLFKDEMKKQKPGLVFPSDEPKSNLVLPPRFRK